MYAQPDNRNGFDDAGDAHPELTKVATQLLRRAFAGHTAATLTASHHWPACLREPIREFCLHGRLAQVPIERLLVCLKRAWRTTPRARLALGELADEVLAAMVTLCIEEYFADAERARH